MDLKTARRISVRICRDPDILALSMNAALCEAIAKIILEASQFPFYIDVPPEQPEKSGGLSAALLVFNPHWSAPSGQKGLEITEENKDFWRPLICKYGVNKVNAAFAKAETIDTTQFNHEYYERVKIDSMLRILEEGE